MRLLAAPTSSVALRLGEMEIDLRHVTNADVTNAKKPLIAKRLPGLNNSVLLRNTEAEGHRREQAGRSVAR
jgi:hypothetical protein